MPTYFPCHPQGKGVCWAWGRILDQTQALAASQIRKSSKSSEVDKLLIFWPHTLDYGISRNIIRKCVEIYLKSVGSSSVLNTSLFYISKSISSIKLFDLCLTSCISCAIQDLKALLFTQVTHKLLAKVETNCTTRYLMCFTNRPASTTPSTLEQ